MAISTTQLLLASSSALLLESPKIIPEIESTNVTKLNYTISVDESMVEKMSYCQKVFAKLSSTHRSHHLQQQVNHKYNKN